jgi:hypothetical protein
MKMSEPPPLPRLKGQSWFHRHRLWLLAGIVVVIIGFVVAFVGSIFLMVDSMMRASDPYEMAVAFAKADQRIIQQIGIPIEEGWFLTGSINFNDSSGEAEMAIPLSGPSGSATIYLFATRSAGQWTFSTLDCRFKDSGERFSIVPDTSLIFRGEVEQGAASDR